MMPASAMKHDNALALSAPPLKTKPTPAETKARAVLDNWRAWPGGQMALIGPARSGRSTLAQYFTENSSARLVRNAEPSDLDPEQAKEGLIIDDADTPPVGETILTAMNLGYRPLLLIGREPPSKWPTMIRDLQSRLDAMPWVAIATPCDLTMELRLAAACRQRFIRLSATTSHYLIRRMQRDYARIETIADALADLAKGNGGQITKQTIAKEALSIL